MENKDPKESTEMARLQPAGGVVRTVPSRQFSLMPQSLGEAMELAKMIAGSDMAPKDYAGKPGNIIIAIQMGADVGLKPMQSLQNIAVINGRPAIWGDAALALCMNGLSDLPVEEVKGEGDARTASCTIKRTGYATAVTRTFSVADAKKAGLWTKPGPWQTYPERMLQMRARGFALRDTCSDMLMGLVLVEEAQDYPAPGTIDVSPTPNGTTPALPPARTALERLPEEVRTGIEAGFTTLNLSPGAQIAKLNEYLSDPDSIDAGAAKLLEWLRTEYAARKGRPRATKAESDNGKKAEPAKDAKDATPKPAAVQDAPANAPAAEEIFKKPEPAAPAAEKKDFVGF